MNISNIGESSEISLWFSDKLKFHLKLCRLFARFQMSLWAVKCAGSCLCQCKQPRPAGDGPEKLWAQVLLVLGCFGPFEGFIPPVVPLDAPSLPALSVDPRALWERKCGSNMVLVSCQSWLKITAIVPFQRNSGRDHPDPSNTLRM